MTALAAVCSVVMAACGATVYTDELGETPQYWYVCCRGIRSFGQQALTFEQFPATFTATEREGSAAAWVPTCGYGKNFAYGTGNWTLVLRARSDDTDNAVIASFGQPCSTSVGANLTLASAGQNRVAVCGNGNNAAHADLMVATVPNAASSFHTYVIQRNGKLVSFWVDGVKCGEITRPNNPGSTCFQFFGCYGGLGNSGFVAGTAAMSLAISELRFYTKALSADALMTVAYPPCDELGYRPFLHLTFNDTVADSADAFGRFAALESEGATFAAGRAGADRTALTFDGTHRVRGEGVAWGANTSAGGNWTALVDAKVEATDNAVIFYAGNGSASACFSLASGGAGKVTLSAYSDAGGHVDRVTADVADAATAFHRYAIVRTGSSLTLWVDGVSEGSIDRDNNPTGNQFCLLAPYAADAANGFVTATQSAVDDFRVYRRALTEAELLKLEEVRQDEIGETPVHGLAFNGDLSSWGKVEPSWTGGTNAAAFGPAEAAEPTCLLGSGTCPQGTNLCWRSGSWTLVLRAKSVETDNAVIAGFGPSRANASACIALASAGAGQVSLSGFSTASTHADLISVEVPTAASEFHTYVIQRVDTTVSLWVDGEKAGELTRATNPTVNEFAFCTLPGGLGSGFVHDDAVAIDDFRLYERALSAREICLVSGVSPVTEAWWTGAAGDRDLANAANWCCTNAAGAQVDNVLPRDYTTVHLAGNLDVPFPAGTSLACEKIVLEAAVLGADLDWRGLALSKTSGTLDLAGHALTLASLGGSAVLTDTVGDGAVHLVVPSGTTVTGSGLSLAGKLRLVKEGTGTYVAVKTQAYSGGTELAAGTAQFGANGDALPFGATGSGLVVDAGATLDVNGKCNEYPYALTLAGGVLANTGAAQSMTVDSFGTVALTADTAVNLVGSLSIRGAAGGRSSLDLGGYVLTVAGNSVFRLCNCDASNGKIVMSSASSVLTLFGEGGNRAATVDLDIGGSMAPYAPSTVRDLTLRSDCVYQEICPATTTVTRVFAPFTTQFQNICLADGATLDVSSYDGTFPLVNTAHDDRTISFETGACVTVDVQGRTLAPGDLILSWPTRPSNVRFRLDESSALHHSVVATASGLAVVRGLVVIVR